jgi:hypothetical protein
LGEGRSQAMKKKKFSNTLKFSLMILLLAMGSGLASGVLAYRLGVEALKGVSQPDNNPSKKFSNAKKLSDRPQPFQPINEKDIIKKAQGIVRDKQTNAQKETDKSR